MSALEVHASHEQWRLLLNDLLVRGTPTFADAFRTASSYSAFGVHGTEWLLPAAYENVE